MAFLLLASASLVDAQILQTLHSFANTNGANPDAALTLGNDGNFYGTTYYGGCNYSGTVFQVTASGTLTTLASFNSTNGANPSAALTLGSDGNFYGTTRHGGMVNSQNPSGMGTIFKVTTNGLLTTLACFNETNGTQPEAGLTLGNDGNFYGTTVYGGMTNASLSLGYGTVFKVTTNGVLTTLAMFRRTNGYGPAAGLTTGSDGRFYGTTSGGSNGHTTGTLFRITTNGTLQTLFFFGGTNGSRPNALTMGVDGILYGTTQSGGSHGHGTMFKVTTNGGFSTVVSFDTNRAHTLTLGNDGNFYGVGSGVVKAENNGTITKLASFDSTNGSSPSSLTLGNDGNFYGTASSGGSGGAGTVFRVTTNGVLTTLVSFDRPNAANPNFLTRGNDENFYGTTRCGGSGHNGTIFQITTNGNLTTLVYFANTNGASPNSLTLGSDGLFYGITREGGVRVPFLAWELCSKLQPMEC
jgi:uncharacterized repeat protein (TIGR03803 family)